MNTTSTDSFLGLVYNIASYALLTKMVASVVNMEPLEFVWTGGDVHIYNNHMDQVKEQLTRTPLDGPSMIINQSVENIEDFVFEDFELVNYVAHPHIAGAVAV